MYYCYAKIEAALQWLMYQSVVYLAKQNHKLLDIT